MEFLPVFLRLVGDDCVVVGGGVVAARKAALLLGAGARVTLVAPALGEACVVLVQRRQVHHLAEAFAARHLDGDVRFVIAACDDRAVNRAVAAAARARKLPVNVVDQPAACSAIVPAIVDRSPVLVAVSTGGASPVLARAVKRRIEEVLSPALGGLAALAAQARGKARAALADVATRRRFWEWVCSGPVAEAVFSGRMDEARQRLEAALADPARTTASGAVYWIDASSGEPDLLTVRAARLLERAEVIVSDLRVAAAVVAVGRREAVRLQIRTSSSSPPPAAAVAAPAVGAPAWLSHAVAGRTVARVVVGAPDPAELRAVRAAGLPHEVLAAAPVHALR